MDREDLGVVAVDDLCCAHLEHTNERHVSWQELDVTTANGAHQDLVRNT